MLEIIRCSNCEKSGSLPVHLGFDHSLDCCSKCNHLDVRHWDFYFCCLDCLFCWLRENEVEELGFPCQDCRLATTREPTGFMAGFEQNGKCRTCKGKKRVKPQRKVVEEEDYSWQTGRRR